MLDPEAPQPAVASRTDPDHPEVRGPLRWLLAAGGVLFLGLATLGVILPLVPTTPFVLVAAACFARSSPRLDRWLRSSRLFGPLLDDWQRDRSISRSAKIAAVAGIVIVGGTSVALFVRPWWLLAIVSAVLIAVIGWIVSRPSSCGSPAGT